MQTTTETTRRRQRLRWTAPRIVDSSLKTHPVALRRWAVARSDVRGLQGVMGARGVVACWDGMVAVAVVVAPEGEEEAADLDRCWGWGG